MSWRRRLRFADEATERAFRDDHAAATQVLYRVSAALALIGWCAIGLVDDKLGGSPENARVISWFRFVVVAPMLAGLLAWGFAPFRLYRKSYEWALGTGIALMLAAIASISLRVPVPELHLIDQAVGGFLLISMASAAITGLRFVVVAAALVPSFFFFLAVIAMNYPDRLPTSLVWLGVGLLTASVAAYSLESLRRRAWFSARELARERERSEALLRNLLPESIAERLKREPGHIAEQFPSATVLFADLVGFTPVAARVPPAELVTALDEIFSRFDALAERLGLEKIKTIGDSYMAVGGVPTPRHDHARAVAEMAILMRDALAERRLLAEEPLALRIGIHSGPVVAGVIGKRKLIYDLWGDTVNVASRMESHGVDGEIQVSDATRALLGDEFELETRGVVAVKGKGEMQTWLLRGRRGAAGA